MKRKAMWGWFLGAGLACGAAWGQIPDPVLPPWSVQLKSGRVVQSVFVPSPIQILTVAGTRTFMPSNLVRLEFPSDLLCVATTIHGDQWYGMAPPQGLWRLAGDHQLDGIWDQVRAVSFLSSTNAAEDPSESWTVNLYNGSRAKVLLDETSVQIKNDGGRIEIPLGLVKNLRGKETEWGVAVVVEIQPGGQAIQGYITGPPLRGVDLGGQALAVPWETLSTLLRTGQEASKISTLQFEQSISGQWTDGTTWSGTMPVSIVSIKGSGGNWVLPTTCIRQLRRNPRGSFSVETTVGEWLTGKMAPRKFSGVLNGQNALWAFSSCALIQWTNPPVSLPESSFSWRLTSGDLLVGTWQEEVQLTSAAPTPVPQVRGIEGQAEVQRPLRTNGQWPVSRFNVRHWASGKLLTIPASSVESVLAVEPRQMPPAIRSSGPSAVWSDEIHVTGGAFRMGRTQGSGSEDEVPPVDLSLESFWMASTPVTVDQFSGFVSATRHVTDAERSPTSKTWHSPGFIQRPDDPVVCVSWRDAVKYCNWRSSVAGLSPCYAFRERGRVVVFSPERNGYRLPMEAEWEYAARSGGQEMLYPWGDEAQESVAAGLANFRSSSSGEDPWPWTNPVKVFPPSPAGFYDMGGNVWEWCQDIYQKKAYAGLLRGMDLASLLNPGAEGGSSRSMRGGSYYNPLDFLRCTARGFGIEQMSAPRVGFRIVRKSELPAP